MPLTRLAYAVVLMIVLFDATIAAAQSVEVGFTQPEDGAVQDGQQTVDPPRESEYVRQSFQLRLAGPNQRLMINPLTGEMSLRIVRLIGANYNAQFSPDNSFRARFYMFDMTEDQLLQIRMMYALDGEITYKIIDSLSKNVADLIHQGRQPDDPEIVELLEAQHVAANELFEMTQAHNEDLSKMFKPDQVDRLKEQAMATAVEEFGGPFKFFETAFEQRGLRNADLTPEQRKKLDDALKKYIETVQQARTELVEEAIATLPDEHRDAIIDAAGIRGLDSSQAKK